MHLENNFSMLFFLSLFWTGSSPAVRAGLDLTSSLVTQLVIVARMREQSTHAGNSDRVIKFACRVRKVTYIWKDREEKT